MDRKTAMDCIVGKTHVVNRDIEYYPIAYILRLHKSKCRHELELHDLKVNSVTVANMEEVRLKE